MAFGIKTNEGATKATHAPGERPGTRAQVKYVRMSAYKARQVIDTIRGKDTTEADDILRYTEREAARVIRKCLASAVANAAHNDGLDPESLYVSAAYVDEGMTIKRYRPRARGRATRIRKRTCHITIIVSPIPPEELARRAKRDAARDATGGRRARTAAEARAARVARSRAAAAAQAEEAPGTDEVVEDVTDETADIAADDTGADDTGADDTGTEDAGAEEAVEAEADAGDEADAADDDADESADTEEES